MNCKKRLAFIFARGGSKGVPGKNTKNFGGLPLIAHAINLAQKCSMIDEVIVSTDDENIAAISKDYGASVPFIRPAIYSGDQSSEIEAWKHAIKTIGTGFDTFVSLPPTAPLRNIDDVNKCIKEYESTDADLVITVKEASRNPFFNMIKLDADNYASILNKNLEGKTYIRRQDVPVVYDMTTVAYVSSPKFVLKMETIFSGKTRSVLIPNERAVDIDTQLDFDFAEFLLKENR